jgi:hypothetical protein
MIQKISLAVIMVFILGCFGASALAGDYYLSYWYLQNRTYENKNSFNRLAFAVLEGNQGYPSNSVIKSVTLEGPDGQITLPPISFTTFEMLYGRYDAKTGNLNYDSEFYFENQYTHDFNGALDPGNYTLTVVDIDGVTIFEGTRYFNGVIELPAISSKSFRGFEDNSGNFICQWDLPLETDFWTASYDISIRCWISIFDKNSYIGDIWIVLPVNAGMLFVPSRIMNLAKEKGDHFKIGLHIKTNDDNNRVYTSDIPLSALKKNQQNVVVVPLN